MSDDSKIDYIQERLDKVVDKVHDISASVDTLTMSLESHTKQDERMYDELKRSNDILAENTESLKDHMRRTQLLEDFVRKVDTRIAPIEREHMSRKVLQAHRNATLKLIAKLGAAVGALGAMGAAAKFLIQFLMN